MSDCAANNDDYDNDNDSNDEDNANDNLIKLEGCGIVSYWQLPANLNRCPVINCRMVFENGAALKKHYKLHHAMHAVFCEPCGWPVMSKCPQQFQTHFRKYHPNMAKPKYGFGKAVKPENNNKQV